MPYLKHSSLFSVWPSDTWNSRIANFSPNFEHVTSQRHCMIRPDDDIRKGIWHKTCHIFNRLTRMTVFMVTSWKTHETEIIFWQFFPYFSVETLKIARRTFCQFKRYTFGIFRKLGITRCQKLKLKKSGFLVRAHFLKYHSFPVWRKSRLMLIIKQAAKISTFTERPSQV